MKITVIYVTYNPNIKLLIKSIDSILHQVDKIILIDNTPIKNENLNIFTQKNIDVIYLKENLGIARAQNIGIEKALKNNSKYIMLSDQDTCYPEEYVENMLKIFSSQENIAAVAPKFIDTNKKNHDGFIDISYIFFRKIFPQNGLHEIMQAIASGKIINAKYLNKIGLMNEMLFIDWVDLEWCWRARKKGYSIIGNADVSIEHKLGDYAKNIGKKEVNLRSPIRHYYITRNAFYLALRDRNLDILHRINLFIKSFRYIIGYPILSKPHSLHLKYVLLGFWHGLIGKLGKLN